MADGWLARMRNSVRKRVFDWLWRLFPGGGPEASWCDGKRWDGEYRAMLASWSSFRRDDYIATEAGSLVAALCRLEPWSLRRVLVAGCGISRTPQLLSYWGHEVTAIDVSSHAIEVASRHQPTEAELAACISIWSRPDDGFGWTILSDDPRARDVLRARRATSGTLKFAVADWRHVDGEFDAIVSQRGFRGASQDVYRESLAAFHRCLAPGGVLLLESPWTAWAMGEGARGGLGIYSAALSMAEAVGFTLLDWPLPALPATPTVRPRELDRRYAMCRWTSG